MPYKDITPPPGGKISIKSGKLNDLGIDFDHILKDIREIYRIV